jgi:FKBP-type peptidyl-prolyl cis-trans isomerase FkpA
MMMNRSIAAGLLLPGLLLLIAGCAQDGTAKESGSEVELVTEQDKVLYALGLSLGGTAKPYDLSPEEVAVVTAGFVDATSNSTPRVDLQVYGPKIRPLAQQRMAARAENEKRRAAEFLAKAAQEEGAEQTASGLVYVEVEKGSGPSPRASDKVKAHYHGTLIDGSVFDSSVERDDPVIFPLTAVIPCWTEGLQKMAVGGKAKLICPSDIAYGDSGRPPAIPPGATLIFEVELIEIPAG